MTYKLIILLYLKLFCLCQPPNDKSSYINNDDFSIKEALYVIRNRKGNVNLEYKTNFEFKNTKFNLKQNFEIIIDKRNKNDSKIFYFIKEKDKNFLLSAEKEGDQLIIYPEEIDLDYALWNITPKINEENQLIYYVQNKKTECYWEYNQNQLKIINKTGEDLNINNEFLFRELYKNVDIRKQSELLEKEPIDVLIKYIDLTDASLNRTGITKINKDYENGEIKYSVRSILQNIPWIRKIFILMPNDKVKYFKPKHEIKEKIIYIKDKNLLGFDSGNSCTFQYNLFKMRQYGLSENFLLMDDDYFIAKPINKNEMFYEENGEIYPAIITSDFYEMDKELINQEVQNIRRKRFSNDPHSPNGFLVRQKSALLFLYEIFGKDDLRYGKKLIEPAFSHNTIPLRMSDLEEIYKYIYDYYEYGKLILYAKERTIYDLQFQTLYWGYVKNKYDRRVCRISSQFYDLTNIFKIQRNTQKLFVINTSQRNYNPNFLIREKQILNKLFPVGHKYELDDDDKKEEKKDIKQYNDQIKIKLSSLFNNIYSKIKTKAEQKNFSLDKEAFFGKLNNYINKTNDYKMILRAEIKFMEEQCFWQEIINAIFVFFFVLLLIYRYLSKKADNIEINN